MDTTAVTLLVLTVALLAAFAAALGWVAHAARSFRIEMERLRNEARAHLDEAHAHKLKVQDVQHILERVQSDVAGLKMAERRY